MAIFRQGKRVGPFDIRIGLPRGREYENLIKSKSSMRLPGQQLIGTYPINKSSLYNSTDCVAVVQWSAEGVVAANQSKSEMNNTSSSSGSTNQAGQETTSSQTPSDDF